MRALRAAAPQRPPPLVQLRATPSLPSAPPPPAARSLAQSPQLFKQMAAACSDLERVFGLPGGCISHTAMGLDQLFWNRPAPGFSRYRTPVQGLYLASASNHPGGGVIGSAGRNAALQCLEDMETNEYNRFF